MYLPDAFRTTDQHALDLIDACPLATLVVNTDTGMVANPIPLIRVGTVLIGHVALANDLHRLVPDAAPVLALFNGPDAYVSPNWYPSKAETHQAVPTWNYLQVQVHGTLHFSHLEGEKRRAVSLSTTRFERQTNGDDGWRMGDAPADYMVGMLAKIVAFRLNPQRITAKAKLSQNREARDHDAVRDALETRAPAVAAAMKAR